jgi:endonuclease YncB( thermonuclease family)
MMRPLIFFLFLVLADSAWAQTSTPLLAVTGGRFVEAAFNDGDSFRLDLPGTNLVARLYFADCPETALNDDTERRRVLDQKRYFGIQEGPKVVEWGRKAVARTTELLKPGGFTVHTSFARAPGRSGKPRTYVMITLADGRDLAAVLVQEGLARAFGTKRTRPDGTDPEEYAATLADFELAAAMRRVGCWSASDPGRIAEMRAEQRQDERKLALETVGVAGIVSSDRPLDLNLASMEELQLIKGIGPATAENIVRARPYKAVRELLRVDGIGPASLKKWEPYLTVGDPAGEKSQ